MTKTDYGQFTVNIIISIVVLGIIFGSLFFLANAGIGV